MAKKLEVPALEWHPIYVEGRPSDDVKRAIDGASGAYAIRRKDSHGVVYVGESTHGTMWRTLLRHFQAPESFTAPKEKKGGANAFATDRPQDYEVAWRVTSRGHRPRGGRRLPDQRAMHLQARWIGAYKLAGHRLSNKDHGLAKLKPGEKFKLEQPPEEDFGDWFARQNPEPQSSAAWRATLRARAGLRGSRVRTNNDAVVLHERAYKAHKRAFEDSGYVARVHDDAAREHIRMVTKAHRQKPKDPFNPDDETDEMRALFEAAHARLGAKNPGSALTELGKLTRLSVVDYREVGSKGKREIVRIKRVLVWPLKHAPALTFDNSNPRRLFIVYTGRVVRASTPDEVKTYRRFHWGKPAAGKVRDGGVAVPPFVVLGDAGTITYTTTKGTDRELTDYVHAFGEDERGRWEPPRVVEHRCKGGCAKDCQASGAVALVGGTYRVDTRGIVG